MGHRISWVAVRGLDRETLLDRMKLAETGRPDEANEADISWATLPNGWTLVYSNDSRDAADDRLADLSQGATVIGAEINETVMYSRLACHEDGRRVWSVTHDSDKGRYNLDTVGEMPAVYEEVRALLFKEQEDDGGEESDTDYIFDVPVELAERLTGYRHDALDPESPLVFMALVSTIPPEPKWWQKLLGMRG